MQTMAVDLTDDLVSMGIATPVTKETAGRKYHKELARQVTPVSNTLSMRSMSMLVRPRHNITRNLRRDIEPEEMLAVLQLADFLRGPLERAGGMMTLPDVYCLFNRARGTELVSPDDLLQVLLGTAAEHGACSWCW
jgi:EAP30/Vps36 family